MPGRSLLSCHCTTQWATTCEDRLSRGRLRFNRDLSQCRRLDTRLAMARQQQHDPEQRPERPSDQRARTQPAKFRLDLPLAQAPVTEDNCGDREKQHWTRKEACQTDGAADHSQKCENADPRLVLACWRIQVSTPGHSGRSWRNWWQARGSRRSERRIRQRLNSFLPTLRQHDPMRRWCRRCVIR